MILGDGDIRAGLRKHLRVRHGNERDTAFVEELGLCRGQARVDLAVVNVSIHGYEIKSDRDNLRRLERQVDFYGKVLDQATLVVGDGNRTRALDIVPEWWGVLRFHESDPMVSLPGFEIVRHGSTNRHRDPRALVELLWLDDAVALLIQRDAARGVRGKPRRVVWDRLCEQCDLDEIATAVRSHLKARATKRDQSPLS